MTGGFHPQVPVVVNALLPYYCQNGWDKPYVYIFRSSFRVCMCHDSKTGVKFSIW